MGCKGISAKVTPSRRTKGEKPVWQRRYWEHRIRDQEDWKGTWITFITTR